MNKSWQVKDIESDIVYELSAEVINLIKSNSASKLENDASFKQDLSSLRNDLNTGSGVKIIRNFPIDSDIAISESYYLDFMRLFGHIMYQNNNGDLVSHIKNSNVTADDVLKKGLINNQTENQTKNRPYLSKAYLEFHTDLADLAGLFCINQSNEGGENRVVSSLAVYEKMQTDYPDLLKSISEPLHLMHQVPSKKDGKNHLITHKIFSEQDGYFASFLLGSYILATYKGMGLDLDPKVADAIDAIQEIAADPQFCLQFKLKPGDILLVNNHLTYHSRYAFEDLDGDMPRHLLRSWVSLYDNQPLNECYKDLYGADNLSEKSIRGGFSKI